MSDETLELFIKQYIEAQTTSSVLFTWHGGETLMRPISFYRRVIELQKKYAAGKAIDNCIQTNGTLLTPEWCQFFKKEGWLVGVSIDGPQEVHDRYRRSRSGRPSFVQVMKGIKLLNQFGVEWNALAVVNDMNVKDPLAFYDFFRSIDCHYIQFTPIVERLETHADGRKLAAVAEAGEGGMMPKNGETSSAKSSTNGCATTWATSSSKSSTPHWQTGWASNRASAPWQNNAATPEPSNGTETSSVATTSSFRNIIWETYIKTHCWN